MPHVAVKQCSMEEPIVVAGTELLDLAIEYAVSGHYKDGLSKDKKS